MRLAVVRFEVSGGAQWKRMLDEIELFVRFSEMSSEIKKQDVVQARGFRGSRRARRARRAACPWVR